ncbi:class F sortase [Nocardioides speluncae]|uniref:class F sortase n=1 Tax=Nocardioides speluncae TaxID=2670337 RepID=UPI0013797E8A|nr:class F sortase [Nocardioides speluncae]
MRRAAAATGLVLALVTTGGGCANGGQTTSGSAGPTATATAAPVSEVADPSRVSVPRLGIRAGLRPLLLGTNGELKPPPYGIAGWYAAGPEPGEKGAAVIAGHLDSAHGPDVFARLGEARRGDRIVVRLDDGGSRTFTITGVGRFAQERFPTRRVYGATPGAELRLITCGGAYDRRAGRYLDNVVVFATAAG